MWMQAKQILFQTMNKSSMFVDRVRRQYLNKLFQNKTSWKIVGGIAFATPIIAIFQGTYLLHDYRQNHGDAPTPDVPSRGLVVVRRRSSNGNNHTLPRKRWSTDEIIQASIRNRSASADNSGGDDDSELVQGKFNSVEFPAMGDMGQQSLSFNNNDTNDERDAEDTLSSANSTPLRILVIGDSLAAGVGTSQTSTPILPETIAQALSKALGGRAVLWTCFGVPGQTSSEIVHSILHLEDIFVHTTKNHTTLLQQFNEWQIKQRQIAQHRIEFAKRRTKEWMEHRKQNSCTDEWIEDDNASSTNGLKQWWKRISKQLQYDLQNLRNILKRDETDITEELIIPNMAQSISDQAVIGEYDIAIVLTGLNDLKEIYLPFMRSSERTNELKKLKQQQQPSMDKNFDEHDSSSRSFIKGELQRILDALLENRMHNHSSASVSKSNRSIPDSEKLVSRSNNDVHKSHLQRQSINNKGPLIVFPALPYQLTVLNQYAPLSWFLTPLINMVDDNKKLLSELYPGLVLFVESPDIREWSNSTLSQYGAVWDDYSVLFKFNDIAQDAKDRIEQLMKRHAERWVIRNGNAQHTIMATSESNSIRVDSPSSDCTNNADNEYLYVLDMMENVTILESPSNVTVDTYPGSIMVAIDGIHPSDLGYDMWGRHIADAIIKEWEKIE